jgi:hypothetical protein
VRACVRACVCVCVTLPFYLSHLVILGTQERWGRCWCCCWLVQAERACRGEHDGDKHNCGSAEHRRVGCQGGLAAGTRGLAPSHWIAYTELADVLQQLNFTRLINSQLDVTANRSWGPPSKLPERCVRQKAERFKVVSDQELKRLRLTAPPRV